jgi:hypothetical protein
MSAIKSSARLVSTRVTLSPEWTTRKLTLESQSLEGVLRLVERGSATRGDLSIEQ